MASSIRMRVKRTTAVSFLQMRWAPFALAAVVSVIAATAPASPAVPHAACGAVKARATVNQFVAAFNRGQPQKLGRLLARGNEGFQWYAVNADPGLRLNDAAKNRATLLRYFAERHRHSERLVLEWFTYKGYSQGKAEFTIELVRSADDVTPEVAYGGKGAINCWGHGGISVWAMGPNSEPMLPAPQSYAQTCQLVSSWCTLDPASGSLPDALRRPLVLPDAACPATGGQHFENGQFGGIVLGHGPVQPLLAPATNADRSQAQQGVLVFRPTTRPGWYAIKTLWFASPDYQGPVYIRGRQLDGTHTPAFGESPALVDPQLGPGATLNGTGGWRTWPGATWLRSPGCYAWQIDGTDFTEVIVFRAIFAPAA
jgi:hypothetical protein